MKTAELYAIGGGGEAPLLPSYQFSLEWAGPEVIDELLARMRSEERQTMNLRTGVDPKMLVCRYDGRPVGWAGLDLATSPEFPELFSLFLYPRFRRYTIGLLLETARWKYLDSQGVSVAYGRMELATNFRLFRYRLSTGLFSARAPEDFPDDWRARCKGCELYGKQCTEQRYIAIDVKQALASGEARIGPVDLDDLPRDFVLKADTMRQTTRELSDSDRRERYRPYWL